MDDTFTLYDLKVEVVAGDRPMVCSHKAGDYFLVQGENGNPFHICLGGLRRGDRLPGSELRGEI